MGEGAAGAGESGATVPPAQPPFHDGAELRCVHCGEPMSAPLHGEAGVEGVEIFLQVLDWEAVFPAVCLLAHLPSHHAVARHVLHMAQRTFKLPEPYIATPNGTIAAAVSSERATAAASASGTAAAGQTAAAAAAVASLQQDLLGVHRPARPVLPEAARSQLVRLCALALPGPPRPCGDRTGGSGPTTMETEGCVSGPGSVGAAQPVEEASTSCPCLGEAVLQLMAQGLQAAVTRPQTGGSGTSSGAAVKPLKTSLTSLPSAQQTPWRLLKGVLSGKDPAAAPLMRATGHSAAGNWLGVPADNPGSRLDEAPEGASGQLQAYLQQHASPLLQALQA